MGREKTLIKDIMSSVEKTRNQLYEFHDKLGDLLDELEQMKGRKQHLFTIPHRGYAINALENRKVFFGIQEMYRSCMFKIESLATSALPGYLQIDDHFTISVDDFIDRYGKGFSVFDVITCSQCLNNSFDSFAIDGKWYIRSKWKNYFHSSNHILDNSLCGYDYKERYRIAYFLAYMDYAINNGNENISIIDFIKKFNKFKNKYKMQDWAAESSYDYCEEYDYSICDIDIHNKEEKYFFWKIITKAMLVREFCINQHALSSSTKCWSDYPSISYDELHCVSIRSSL